MGLVVIGVQCVAAAGGKCYARELVAVAEEHAVPLTWLIGVSGGDPMGNANLYRNEYLHRIPAWHEIGLYLELPSADRPGAAKARLDLVRLGKEVLKQCHVKPTACWATGDIAGSDVRVIEDIGVLALVAPDGRADAAPVGLFRPAYDDPASVGEARLHRLLRPVVDLGEVKVESGALASSPVTLLTVRDDRDDTARLGAALQAASDAGSPVRVMTAAILG